MIPFLLVASLWASPALKRRTTVPANFRALTVEAVLKARQDAYPVGAAGRLTGFVTQRSHEADGDWHIGVGSSSRGTRKTSVVCEITPSFQKRIAAPKLGEHVTVSGWLYWDGHHLHEPGRGTEWELHPVSNIAEE